METKKVITIVAILGLLASCAPMSPHEAVNSPVLRKVVQNARTRSDHDALTKYFENLAEEMQVKAEEQRKLLEHYEEKGYLYGRQALSRQSHTWALMNRYELAVKTSLANAAAHRQKAAELARGERDGYAAAIRRNSEAATTNAN
ncbi:hypothetical protein SAMN05216420_102273 [Nitrosospira sp. Nl5]|uniref:hypothetical protein n=1 Tax=Nitrosospira sp. Nl5 TaxID=200120 RepID=UPI0008911BA1|nr:hypothetical protein [Nitrosospira sp. Nl5]SCY09404.1 hypothetical protein SAMN05216420_102273 [Nitrosospira sp. Nl5]